MKKIRILLFILLVIGGGTMLFGCSKKTKEVTIEDMQKRDPKYEGLCAVTYSHGGGMEGSSHRIEYEKKEDQVTLTFSDSDDPGQADLVCVYRVKDIFDELDDFVKKYNLSVWEDFPESEMEVLDAPSTSVSLTFLPPEGERFPKWVSIDYDREIPREGYDILKELMSKIIALRDDKDLVDVYFEGDHEIRVGRDIENSDEEIRDILLGYWSTDEKRFDVNTYTEEADLLLPDQEWKHYVLKEQVNEPYRDSDSSWYRIYAGKEDETDLLYVSVKGPYILVEDGADLSIQFTRGR
ncbi:MAG: hypothetical protein K5908_07980 [Erysipelotrichaceae bacterium]|nr:hypothetical protein [Erysipelotrichaceae bacterium]